MTRSPFANFLLGIACGAALCGVLLSSLFARREDRLQQQWSAQGQSLRDSVTLLQSAVNACTGELERLGETKKAASHGLMIFAPKPALDPPAEFTLAVKNDAAFLGLPAGTQLDTASIYRQAAVQIAILEARVRGDQRLFQDEDLWLRDLQDEVSKADAVAQAQQRTAGAPQDEILVELLNTVRPGLGTMLEKIHTALSVGNIQ